MTLQGTVRRFLLCNLRQTGSDFFPARCWQLYAGNSTGLSRTHLLRLLFSQKKRLDSPGKFVSSTSESVQYKSLYHYYGQLRPITLVARVHLTVRTTSLRGPFLRLARSKTGWKGPEFVGSLTCQARASLSQAQPIPHGERGGQHTSCVCLASHSPRFACLPVRRGCDMTPPDRAAKPKVLAYPFHQCFRQV